jgi:hypothetical protein
MNVLKNFEALFVVTLGLACAANYALDNAAVETPAPITASATAPAAQDMHVVVVSAKRLSAEQKQQSLRDERTAMAASTAASKI